MFEKEAKEYGKKATAWLEDREPLDQRDIENAYLAGAELREKQIQIDAEQIRALQKQNGELTDKVNNLEEKLANADYQLEGRDNEIKELKVQTFFLKDSLDQEVELHQHAEDYIKSLEAQIKKMQNCRNCKNEKIEGVCGHFTQVGWCRDWELAD